MNVAIKVLEELEQITGTDQVRRDLDIDLFKEDLLDSLGIIQLLVALGEDFQIQLSPAEIDRAIWSTPRKIIADIEERSGMKKKNCLHLGAALAAVGIIFGMILEGTFYAKGVEGNYIHAFAPIRISPTYTGIVLQKEAFQAPDLLPVYGTSELFYYGDTFRANHFFYTYPTGFNVFEVAKGGINSLLLAQDLAGLGNSLRGKKVVISFTPSMFFYPEINRVSYKAGFSQMHANEMIFSPSLSLGLKQAAARRMIQYPETLKKDPLLTFAIERLASSNLIDEMLYWMVYPLGRAETLIYTLQDHQQVLAYIQTHPDIRPQVERSPNPAIDWNAEIQSAEALQMAHSNSNVYGIDNQYWHKAKYQLNSMRLDKAKDKTIVQDIHHSQEWTDLNLLLRVLKESGAQALIVSRPINGTILQAAGISAATRQVYYDQLRQTVKPYGFPVVDYQDHDMDIYFSVDLSSHTSRKGWVYVDQTLDAFYHNTLH